MTSQPRRDPVSDPLLTPENAALLLIDYQPPQVNTIRSMDSRELIANAVSLAETAKLYGLPMLLPPKGLTGPRGFARCTRGVIDSPERDADAPRCSGRASLAAA